jgi:hypothetical protein
MGTRCLSPTRQGRDFSRLYVKLRQSTFIPDLHAKFFKEGPVLVPLTLQTRSTSGTVIEAAAGHSVETEVKR